MDPEQESRARCWGRAGLREQKGEERVCQELSDGALMRGRGGAGQCGPVWITQTHSSLPPEAVGRLGALCSKGL